MLEAHDRRRQWSLFRGWIRDDAGLRPAHRLRKRRLWPDRGKLGHHPRRGRHAASPPLNPPGKGHGVDLNRRAHQRRGRSEEHTSELQSRADLVCRLLLEKKKKNFKLRPLAKKTTIRRRTSS